MHSFIKTHKVQLTVAWLTFFFGFFAGAVLNFFLIITNSSLVKDFRASLNFKSSIYGDGIVLPVVNFLIADFLIKNKKLITKGVVGVSLLIGSIITAYFHITQAVNGLVNWTMPTPWHWNALGLWHAIYMYSVSTLLGLFYLVSVKHFKAKKGFTFHTFWVTVGLVVFYILLRMDY